MVRSGGTGLVHPLRSIAVTPSEPRNDASGDPEVPPRAPARQKTSRRVFAWVATVVTVVLLCLFLWDQRDELSRAFQTSWENLVLLLLLSAVGQVANATEFWMLYRAGGSNIGWMDNFSSFNASQLGNFAPLQAGSVYRIHFIKQTYGVSYPRSLTTYAQNVVITIGAGGLCGLVGVCATALTSGHSFSWIMFAVTGGMLVGAVVFAFVPLPHGHWLPGKLKHWWRDFHTGWELVRKRPRSALEVLALELARMVLSAARLAVAFSVLGVHEPFVLYLVLAPVASVSTILAFTPGAIGIREAAIAGAALALGFKLPTGLLGASVDRGAMIVVTVAMGALGYAHTTYRLRQVARRATGGEVAAPVT